MPANGNWSGGVEGGYVTREELKETVRQIGQQVGSDLRKAMEKIIELQNAFNQLKEELGTAQNTTAELVDALALHLEACMEQLGLAYLGPDGRTEVSDGFKQWCADRIAKVEEFRKAEKAGVN